MVFSSYTFSFVSEPAVTNLSPVELYAHAKICFEGSINVARHELVVVCQIFILPSASAVRITFTHQMKFSSDSVVVCSIIEWLGARLT